MLKESRGHRHSTVGSGEFGECTIGVTMSMLLVAASCLAYSRLVNKNTLYLEIIML